MGSEGRIREGEMGGERGGEVGGKEGGEGGDKIEEMRRMGVDPTKFDPPPDSEIYLFSDTIICKSFSWVG